MKVKFSIVIPLYNKESYILETLRSVFNQTFSNFEIVIVDDASTDKSLEIVKELNDKRIRVVKHEKNLGLSATRNTGILNAENDYIAFLDADDFWHTTFLERIVMLIKAFPEQKVFATYYEENFNGKIINPKTKIPFSKKGSSFVVSNFFEFNMGRLILTQSCLVTKKEVLENINSYDASITFAEDIDFFIRCFSKYNLAYHYDICHTQNTTVTSSLTQSSTQDKTYPDLKKYIDQSANTDKFIYFYMYCFCQRLKLEKRHNQLKKIRKEIDIKHLNVIQVVLLYLPYPFYKLLIKFKKVLIMKGIQPTSYR